MKEENKTRIAIQLVDFAKRVSINPWGDFGKIAVVSFHSKDRTSYKEFYFKLTEYNGTPVQMTEEEYKEACHATFLAKQPLPYLVEL